MFVRHLESSQDTYDICVVGAGPVGISLALDLASQGQTVLLIESGGFSVKADTQELSAAETFDERLHDDMRIAVARCLGGTSSFWGGRCVPYDPIDFEPRSGVLEERLWPIAYEDIEKYYDDACGYANCGSAVFKVSGLAGPEPSPEFTFDSLERWSAKPRFGASYRESLQHSKNVHVLLGATVTDIGLKDGLASSLLVCRDDGSRATVSVAKLVLCGGGVETTRLLLNVQRRHPYAFGGIDGPLGRYYMGHLIGEIADICFDDSRYDEALDFNLMGGAYSRRRFVASADDQRRHSLPNVSFWPVVPVCHDATHGSGALSAIALAMAWKPLGGKLISEAIRKRHVGSKFDVWRHVANVLRDLPETTRFVSGFAWKRYVSSNRIPGFFLRNRSRTYGLAYHAEHLPNAESRVLLGDTLDRNGMRRANIQLRFSSKDAEGVARSHAMLDGWLRSNEIGRLRYRNEEGAAEDRILSQASHGTHQVGLLRMGTSPNHAIVDRNLKCFGTENIYIAGTGVLPTSSQANPTLTAIALALRLSRESLRAR